MKREGRHANRWIVLGEFYFRPAIVMASNNLDGGGGRASPSHLIPAGRGFGDSIDMFGIFPNEV